MLRLLCAGWVVGSLATAGCRPDEGDDTDIPSGDCFDGERNGSESDIDCGGACDVHCGIDQACADGDDCMFSTCEDDVCAAPPDAATPTGPVTATWGPEGGTVAVVTDEGVSVAIDVPAGALDGPIELTFTPRPPGAGEWVDVAVGSPGVLFAVPATLTVTLPASVTLPAEAMADFADGATGEALIALPTTVSGTTATTAIGFLGSPGAPALRMIPEDWETFSVELREMLLPRLVQTLRARFDELVASRRYEDAIATGMSLVALVQRQDDPAYEAAVGTLLTDMKSTACGRLQEELDQLEIFGNARCPWEARKNVEAVMIWAKLTQHLDGVGGACAVLASGAWDDEVQAELDSAKAIAETNPVAFRACLCETPESEGGPPEGCGRGATDDDTLWKGRIEGVGYNTQSHTRLAVLGDSGVAGTFTSAYGTPYREDVHQRAWDLCHDDSEQWVLAALSREVADGAPVLRDLQYCATSLGLDVQDDLGEVVASAVAGGEAPTAIVDAASVNAVAGGTLVFSGPIRALVCHEDPPRVEADELVVKRVAPSGTTEVGRRGPNGGGFLAEPGYTFDLDVDTLREGLQDDEPITLELWRESPACGGTYGPATTRLFTVEAASPSLAVTLLSEGSYWSCSGSPDALVPANAQLPTTWTSVCGTLTANMPTSTRVELEVAGQNTMRVALRFAVPAPGSFQADIPVQAVRNTLLISYYAETSPTLLEGIFASAPKIVAAGGQGSILCAYPCPDASVWTSTWDTVAGVGVLHLMVYPAPSAPSTVFTIEYTPD